MLLWLLPLPGAAADTDAVCPPEPAAPGATEWSVPFGQGILWRVSAPGLEPSHLFGTIHVDDPGVLALPDTVATALEQARRVVLEIDLDDRAQSAFALASRVSQPLHWDRALAPEILGRLFAIAHEQHGLAPTQLELLKPWALFTLLSRPPPGDRPVLDAALRQRALALQIPVFGLETVAELTGALDAIRLDDQMALLRASVCAYDQLAEQVDRLVELYLARDLDGMLVLTGAQRGDAAVFERFLEQVLFVRNERMLARLEGHLEAGRAFVAVGALHLPGDRGLLLGLRELGFSLQRIE